MQGNLGNKVQALDYRLYFFIHDLAKSCGKDMCQEAKSEMEARWVVLLGRTAVSSERVTRGFNEKGMVLNLAHVYHILGREGVTRKNRYPHLPVLASAVDRTENQVCDAFLHVLGHSSLVAFAWTVLHQSFELRQELFCPLSQIFPFFCVHSPSVVSSCVAGLDCLTTLWLDAVTTASRYFIIRCIIHTFQTVAQGPRFVLPLPFGRIIRGLTVHDVPQISSCVPS